ncbi:hypothetical protein Pfo_028601 [Paulownia fortunei]|nr:hypothetical protein Pfo_028601 [Paulownia fortunei]
MEISLLSYATRGTFTEKTSIFIRWATDFSSVLPKEKKKEEKGGKRKKRKPESSAGGGTAATSVAGEQIGDSSLPPEAAPKFEAKFWQSLGLLFDDPPLPLKIFYRC